MGRSIRTYSKRSRRTSINRSFKNNLCSERNQRSDGDKKETSEAGFLARCSPVLLPLSKQTRLERLHPEAYLKESSAELQIPIPEKNPAEALSNYLKDLVPVTT